MSSDLEEGGDREGKLGFLERGLALTGAVVVVVGVGSDLVAALRGVVCEGLDRETLWEVQFWFWWWF